MTEDRIASMFLQISAVIVGSVALLAGTLTTASADTLTIQGSSTFNNRLMVSNRTAIEAASGHKLTVVPTKSSDGILALFDRRADLAMISASLESEVEFLRKANSKLPFERLRSFPISRTRIAFAVHPSNTVRLVSVDVIRRVLLGEIDNWRTLGGPDLPIRVVLVGGGGGVTVAVEAALLGGKQLAPANPIRVQGPLQVANMVQDDPGALGLAQLGVLRQHRLPELATGRPVEQQLNLVSVDEPSPAMKAVIEATRLIATAKLD
jgi:phosphate transport system substrate-binding protein